MWGGGPPDTGRPSMAGLVANGTLDLRAACILWLLAERRASLIVAAGPRLAGKTTVLLAAVDLMPPTVARAHTRGVNEDFAFLSETEPANTVVLVPELSDHTPAYLWGEPVLRVFEAMERGYALAATLHADAPRQTLDALVEGPLRARPALASQVHAIANLRVLPGTEPPARRLNLLSLVVPSPRGYPPGFVTLARWQPSSDSLDHMATAQASAALGARLGMAPENVEPDLARRAGMLRQWVAAGLTLATDLAPAVAAYYRRASG